MSDKDGCDGVGSDEGLTKSQIRYRRRRERETARAAKVLAKDDNLSTSNVIPFGDKSKGASPVVTPPPGTKDETDTRRGSERPLRVQFGKRWTEIMTAVKSGEYTWEEFARGLSSEELARGQLKDKNGGFAGRPPSLVPRAFFNACVKELMERGQESWRMNYLGAIDAMTKVASDPTVKPSDRIKAAQFVIERMEGKVPERLQVSVGDPWQDALDAVVTDMEAGAIASAKSYLARQEAGQGSGEED